MTSIVQNGNMAQLNRVNDTTETIVYEDCLKCDCKKFINNPLRKAKENGFSIQCICGHEDLYHYEKF